ncbi:MAG: carboxypeptidase-like regulatory domain-containing protein [Bacteroidia bacterium]|nr:carboxypeptidase-like regulatory domain-containing protein [Bacteroidia bacterium]MDW8302921.1 carboxypeptidase-like regulatory domain-containing protein [Bacteroidia bacterium]
MNQSLAYCTFLNTQPVLQKGSLRGRIVNQSQEPVPNIKVMVAELGVYTYTNAQGEYAFCNFPEGQYTVIFDDGKVQKILCPLKMPKNLIYNIEW